MQEPQREDPNHEQGPCCQRHKRRDGSLSVETGEEATGDGRRRITIYHAWSKVAETTAPLEMIENRYPTLFETRRILYPRLAEFADPTGYDQGIGGFLDNIQLARFASFGEVATKSRGRRLPRLSASTLTAFELRSRPNSSPTLTRSS